MNRFDLGRTMPRLRRSIVMAALGLACLALAMPSLAQRRAGAPEIAGSQSAAAAAALPTWERLTPAQREQLIAPMRERWNANPAQRQRMLGHATRWQQLTPEQRQRALRGRDRLQAMSPAERAEARAAFDRLRALPEADRKALRAKVRAMTPEQRAAWLEGQRAPR